MQSPHVQDAITYAMATVDGKRVAGRLEILACQRFLDDLDRSARKDHDFPYFFDEISASKPCRFVEGMKHVKGPLAGKNIVLEPWQSFAICNIFGWLHVETKLRRFRTAYEEVARKNAKSTKIAPIGLYMLCADGEEGSEVYTAATTRDQAKIVYEIAVQMIRRDKDFRKYFGVDIGQSAMLPLAVTQRLTGSKMQALSAQGNTLDGLNPHCSLIDELHAHNSPAVYNVLDTAMGARAQPLLYAITTAGYDQSGICFQIRNYLAKVLDGSVVDNTFFGVIYTLDDGDEWAEEGNWAKANPNLGISVQLDDIQRQCRRALEIPTERNDFKTKRLNLWVNAATSWMPMEKWNACRVVGMQMADFAHCQWYLGVDMATKKDIASVACIAEDDGRFALFGRHFLPEIRAQEKSHKNADLYAGWAEEGKVHLTSGNVTDQEEIEDFIKWFCESFDVVEIGYDPYEATHMAISLMKENIPMIEVGQNVRNLSEPTKKLEELALERKLMHDDDVLSWCVSNVVTHEDVNSNVYPKKQKGQEHQKIDAAIATIIALNRYLSNQTEPFPYQERGLRVLSF